MRNGVQPRGAAAPPGAQTRGADAGRTAGLVGPAFSATLARAAGFSPPPHSAPSIFSSLCSRSPGHEPITALSWSRNEHPSWLPIDFTPGDTGAICLCQRPLRTGARGPRCASWLTSSRRERRHWPALKSGTPPPQERKWDRAEGVRGASQPLTSTASVLASSLIKCGSRGAPAPVTPARRAGSGYTSPRGTFRISEFGPRIGDLRPGRGCVPPALVWHLLALLRFLPRTLATSCNSFGASVSHPEP